MERTVLKDHEDRIAEKGSNSLSQHNLVHKFISMLQAMKIADAKAAVDKELEKLEKLPAWQMTKVKSKAEVIKEAQKEQIIVHFCYADGHLSSQEIGVRTEASKKQRELCCWVTQSETILALMLCRTLVFLRTRNVRKMVWNAHLHAERFVEPLCRDDNASSPRKWTSLYFEQQERQTEDL